MGVAVGTGASQAKPPNTKTLKTKSKTRFIAANVARGDTWWYAPTPHPRCYNQHAMTTEKLLEGLNPPQREAVETVDGPLLILAGPGSGKTRVITTRIAYLMRVVGVYPSRMMAVTFTNKASKEMRERVFDLVGEDTERLTLGTFHAICVRILRTSGQPIGLDRNLVIYDEDDKASIIKDAMKDLNIDPRNFPPRGMSSAISASKSQMIDAQDHRLHVHSYFDEVVGRVFQRYQAILEENNGVDFDDLLLKAVQLFDRSPETLEKYANRYRYLLIDEFQDTNVVQYRLAKQMASQHGNICVVGDPDQSIYSWRHADIRNILSFEKDFPKAKVIYLEQNYRSTQTILESAQNVIAANQQRKEKNLWTDNGQGVPITMSEAYNEQDEAQTVAKEIERLMRDDDHDLGDIAVMYRTNLQSRVLEESFLRYGIQYRLVGGTRFYERREVKDIVAYLRLVHNPYDSVSLRRVINVPKRGIGQKTVDGLMMWAQQLGMPPYTALQLLAHNSEGNGNRTRATFRQRGATHADQLPGNARRAARSGQGRGRCPSHQHGGGQDGLQGLPARLRGPRRRALGKHHGAAVRRRRVPGPGTRREPDRPIGRRGPGIGHRRAGRQSQRRDPDHAPPGQGARISGGVPGRDGGRTASSPPLHRRPRPDGGGASAVLRRA